MDRNAEPLVVGVDGSAASDAAVRWAVHEVTMRGLLITVITVVAPTLTSSVSAPDNTITHRNDRGGQPWLAFDEASRCGVPLVALHAWSR